MKNIRNMSLTELLATQAAVGKAIEESRKDTAAKFVAAVKQTGVQQGLRPGEDFLVSGPITRVSIPTGYTQTKVGPITVQHKIDRPTVRSTLKKLRARTGFKVPVKYRHPKHRLQTWTGRGRTPRWLAAELKAGKKLTAFLV